MYDQRFRRFSQDSFHMAQRTKARDEILAQVNDIRAVEETIGRWWLDQFASFVANGGASGRYPEDDFQAYLSSRPVTRLPDNAVPSNYCQPLFEAFTCCLKKLSDSSGSSNPYLSAAWRIISSSLGYILGKVETPSIFLFGLATHSIGGFDSWSVFNDSFVKSCQETTTSLSQWIQVLKEVPNDPIAYYRLDESRDGSDGGESHIREEANAWIQDRSPTLLWGISNWTDRFEPSSVSHLDSLLSLSPKDWLQVVDQIPSPELVRQFACRRLVHDRDLILTALDLADPCLNKDLQSTGHPAVLFLAESILQHAEVLHTTLQSFIRNTIRPQEKDTVQEAREEIAKLEREIPEWFDTAFGRLSMRPDGPPVGLSYVAHLLYNKLRGFGRHDEKYLDIREVAINSLLGKLGNIRRQGRYTLHLSAKLWDIQENQEKLRRGWTDGGNTPPPPKRGRRLSADQGAGATYLVSAGLPHLLAATLLWSGPEKDGRTLIKEGETIQDRATEDNSFLVKWYRDTLCGRDPAISSVANPFKPTNIDWIPWALSGILNPDTSSDVAPSWEQIWAELAPQRRRAMHWMYVEDYSSTEASIFHILVGCRALDRWSQTSDRATQRNLVSFWEVLFEAIRQLWLCTPIDPNAEIRSLLNQAIARMPYFKEDFETKEEFLDWVEIALFSLGGDLVAITSAVINLMHNGMPFSEIQESFRRKDIDLTTLIQEARELYKHGLSGGTPDYFQELENSIVEPR